MGPTRINPNPRRSARTLYQRLKQPIRVVINDDDEGEHSEPDDDTKSDGSYKNNKKESEEDYIDNKEDNKTVK
jgi:hypothetical protein